MIDLTHIDDEPEVEHGHFEQLQPLQNINFTNIHISDQQLIDFNTIKSKFSAPTNQIFFNIPSKHLNQFGLQDIFVCLSIVLETNILDLIVCIKHLTYTFPTNLMLTNHLLDVREIGVTTVQAVHGFITGQQSLCKHNTWSMPCPVYCAAECYHKYRHQACHARNVGPDFDFSILTVANFSKYLIHRHMNSINPKLQQFVQTTHISWLQEFKTLVTHCLRHGLLSNNEPMSRKQFIIKMLLYVDSFKILETTNKNDVCFIYFD